MRILVSIFLFCASLMTATSSLASIEMVEAEDYYGRLLELLSAEDVQSVDVIQFRFSRVKNERLKTQEILNRLIQLKDKAEIRVFLDNHDSNNDEAVAALTEAGIEVRTTTEQTSHTKAISINHQKVLFGSTNWTHTSLSYNNEINVLFDNPAFGQNFKTYFDKLWSGEIANTVYDFPEVEQSQLITDKGFHQKAIEVIRSAAKTLDITTYFLAYREQFKDRSDKIVGDLLQEIANQIREKNVRVRFFLDYNGIPTHTSHTDSAVNAIRSLKEMIVEGKSEREKREFDYTQVLEVYYDSFNQISHGKIILADAEEARPRLLTGSANLYWRDLTDNLQLSLYSENKELTRAFHGYVNKLIGSAGLYYRFWRGINQPLWEKDVVNFYTERNRSLSCLDNALARDENKNRSSEDLLFSYEDFECLLNLWLIPATPSYAAEMSLQAYVPVLTSRNRSEPVHDEIAIVVYNNEAEYRRLRNSGGREGETYGPLHMDVFGTNDGMRSSGSAVPLLYTGKINYIEKAGEQVASYNLFNNRTDWQNGNTIFRTLVKNESVSLEEYTAAVEHYLNTIHRKRGIGGYMVLISDSYVAEYINVDDRFDLAGLRAEADSILSGVATIEDTLKAQDLERTVRDPLAYTPLKYGEGGEGMAGNVRFTIGKKPGQIRHYRLED